MMEPKDYEVIQIDGEYATLQESNGMALFIALALLPEGTDLGTHLHYECFTYTITDEA